MGQHFSQRASSFIFVLNYSQNVLLDVLVRLYDDDDDSRIRE